MTLRLDNLTKEELIDAHDFLGAAVTRQKRRFFVAMRTEIEHMLARRGITKARTTTTHHDGQTYTRWEQVAR